MSDHTILTPASELAAKNKPTHPKGLRRRSRRILAERKRPLSLRSSHKQRRQYLPPNQRLQLGTTSRPGTSFQAMTI